MRHFELFLNNVTMLRFNAVENAFEFQALLFLIIELRSPWPLKSPIVKGSQLKRVHST